MILRLFALVFFALFARAMGAVSKTVILAEGSRVSGEPDAATWTSFSEACIDKGGGLVACANTSQDRRIIYKALGGEVVTRVATGQSIPVQDGASSDTLNFPQWQSPVRATSQGRFVMYARLLRTPAGSNDQGWNAIVYGDGAGLRLVARIGDPMPGTGEPIAAFSRSVQLDPQGKVIFGARTANYSSAMMRWSPAGVETIQFSSDTLRRFVASDWLVSDSGEIVAQGLETLIATSKSALARWTPDGSSLIARQGDPIPGRAWEFYHYFPGVFSCNVAGDVLFAAAVGSQNSPYPGNAEYWHARPNGSVELIASTVVYGPVVNSAGDVAYYSDGLQLKRVGEHAETIGGPYEVRPEMKGALPRFSLDARGGVLFQTGSGLWYRGAGGDPVAVGRIGEKIVHEGSEYNIAEIQLTSSLSGGEDGMPRALNDWGQIAFVARLSKTSGAAGTDVNALMLATLPGGGDPARKPVANPDFVDFRHAVGVAVKLDVLGNDASPAGAPVAIQTVTQGQVGTVSVRDGFVYYTPGKLFKKGDFFRYSISNTWGISEEGTVVVQNPYLASDGSYSTEVMYGGAQVGTASFTLSKAGRITGRIQFGDQLLKLTGLFEGGTYQQSFTLKDEETVTVSLQLQTSINAATRLSGAIELSSGATLEINPTARFGLPLDSKAMRLTGQFRTDGDLSLPKGIGFLTGTLSSSGAFVARGRLPDDQPFSAGSRMKADGSLVFDCAPYGKGRGRLSGSFAKTSTVQGCTDGRQRLSGRGVPLRAQRIRSHSMAASPPFALPTLPHRSNLPFQKTAQPQLE